MQSSLPDARYLAGIYRAVCDRLDAGRLSRKAIGELAEDSWVVGLGKVAHLQVRTALAAGGDLRPLLSISTEGGPESWAIAGDHPVPGARSFEAGAQLLARVREVDGEPITLLLSGGGSALAALPAPGLAVEDKVEVTRLLLRSGLDIGAVNTVRRRLSAIKGGRLALAARHSPWRVFVLSDVVGNDPRAVSSGPCVSDDEPPGAARRVLEAAGLWSSIPARVRAHLEDYDLPNSLAGLDVRIRVLAGAEDLAREAAALADVPATVLPPVTSPVERCAERYLAWMRQPRKRPSLLVASGEPSLAVRGRGQGGRAQHLALLMAKGIAGQDATFLAAGTDGRDGDTHHAGAIVDGSVAARTGGELDEAISRFDSASFHARHGTGIPQWSPSTHLGELHLLLVR